jgi:hypothetical protein
MKALPRRTLLRGAAGVALALPFLDAMAPRASAASFPKRFVVFFTGLGTVKGKWAPTGTETSFSLGPILSPLAPFQDRLLVLEGIDMESAYHGPGDPHQQGIGHALTGAELLEGDLFVYSCNALKTVGWGGGVSLDQLLAQRIGGATKLPSLELGVQVEFANVSARVSYQGPGLPVPPDDDPAHVFDRVFGDLSESPKSVALRDMKRRRVLDAVLDDYRALAPKLGAEDRYKLDSHLGAVADLERRLHLTHGGAEGACEAPSLGPVPAIYANDDYPAIGRLQMDLLAAALACDLTRVATLQWTTVQTGKVFTWLGQTEPHHTLSHASDLDAPAQQALIDIGTWHSGELAYLLGKLASMPEGDGSVLDNTIVLWCTDVSRGNTHSRRDMPYVIAGSGGGALQTGRHLKYAGAPHNDLLLALALAMDVPLTTFGDPAYNTGPLTGLTG